MSSKFTFTHPSKLRPVGTLPAPVPPMPQWYRFSVHVRYGGKFNPVHSPALYVTSDYRDAFDFLEYKLEYMPNTKKRLLYVKQIGSKHKHTWYDERFEAALMVQDVDSDEFYEEPTDDDKVSVQIHRYKPATWRGMVKRQEPNRGIREDEIPF